MVNLSANSLLERCRDAARRHSNGDAQAALFDFGKTHCLRPIKVVQTSCVTGKPREILVDCGRCWRCRTTRKNEWITRMYSHCEAFKHVYYVTLTYRSLRKDISPDSPSWLLREYLKGALWHLDSRNSTRHLSWNPTVLCKEHYQGFMKRLRRNTGLNDITYAICGEYGHEHARPHMHLILWTNGTITKDDIEKAWSLRYVRYVRTTTEHIDLFTTFRRSKVWCQLSHSPKAPTLQFGRVDFHDLVANGSFCDPSVQVQLEPGQAAKSGHYVFGYVCKYLLKSEFNYNRVKLAWDAMNVHGNSHLAWIERCMSLDPDKEKAKKFYRLKLHFKYPDAEASLVNFYSYHNLQRVLQQNENESWSTTLISCKDGALSFHQRPADTLYLDPSTYVKCEAGVPQFRWPATYEGFSDLHRPFFEVSRSTPLGSLYAKAHLSEHAVGVYTRYPLQPEKTYVIPRYFNRVTSEADYPLRTFSSRSATPSASKGCLPLLRSDMESLVQGGLPQLVHSIDAGTFSRLTPVELHDYLNRYALKVGRTRCLVLRHQNDDPSLEGEIMWMYQVASFTYDRQERSYVNTGIVDWLDFVKIWLPKLNDHIIDLSVLMEESNFKRDRYLDAVSLLDSVPFENAKCYNDLIDEIEKIYQRKDKQFTIDYDLFHNYLD